jgi:Trypsin-co-occurring domain 2
MSDQVVAGLAETIKALRAELTTAMESGEHEALRFQVGSVELEVTLAITREGGVDGGVRFGVISFGAKGGLSDEATNRLSLSLQPVVAAGDGRSRPAEIRGTTRREPAVSPPEHPASPGDADASSPRDRRGPERASGKADAEPK